MDEDNQDLEYLIANKIRMKLLKLIDQEIQNQKEKFQIKDNCKNQLLSINFEETYSQEENENYFEVNEKSIPILPELKKYPKRSAPLQKYIYSNNIIQKETIENSKKHYSHRSLNHFPLYNNTICYKHKKYLLKRDPKISSTMIIYPKLKNDEKFLKYYCESLKIIPKKNKSGNSSRNCNKKNKDFILYKSTNKINSKSKLNRMSSLVLTSPNKKSDNKSPVKTNRRKSLFAIGNIRK